MFAPVLLAASILLAPTTECEGPLTGLWSFTAEESTPQWSSHSFDGLMSENIRRGNPSTNLSVFISENFVGGLGARLTVNAFQDCTQTVTDGAIELTCAVKESGGVPYNPDRFLIMCDEPGSATATLLTAGGEIVAQNMVLRRIRE